MTTYMPAGAHSAWETICADNQREYVEDMMIMNQVKEDYEDCVYKFYETGLSYKAAEAMAKLWAEAYAYDPSDANAATIAQVFGFEHAEALLLLGKTDEYIEETRLEEKLFSHLCGHCEDNDDDGLSCYTW